MPEWVSRLTLESSFSHCPIRDATKFHRVKDCITQGIRCSGEYRPEKVIPRDKFFHEVGGCLKRLSLRSYLKVDILVESCDSQLTRSVLMSS